MKYRNIALSATLGTLLTATPLFAANVRTISTDEAKGASSEIPTISVWPGFGLNINFIPTGQTVKKVWLDDISRIGIDFDGQLCNASSPDCEASGASVIHLRQIKPINFPGLLKTKTTLLSVVTEGQGGEKELYQFRVSYGKGAPQYVSVNVVPPLAPPTVVPAGAPFHPGAQPLPSAALTTPNTPTTSLNVEGSISPTRTSTQRTSIPPKLVPVAGVASPPPEPSIEAHVKLIKSGLANARKQKLITKERRNLYLGDRVERYISSLREGTGRKQAALKAKIPLHFIDTLERLGQR